MKEEIRFFGLRGSYGWLSNFYIHEMYVRGVAYASVEHYYQAAKAANPEEAEGIRLVETPGEAKKLGQFVVLRSNWDGIKAGVMSVALFAKFKDEHMVQRLLLTHPAHLIEDSPWDMYWGGKLPNSKNMLGYLLEIVRERLLVNCATL